MVDSRCHSFEDPAPARIHEVSLTSSSRSISSQDIPVHLTGLETTHLPLLTSANASQISLSLKPKAHAPTDIPRLKENRTAGAISPDRGRGRLRLPFNENATRKTPNSPTSPDRFIPKREFGDATSTTFRVSKHPQHLSADEKLFRRRLPGDDPFLPTAQQPPGFPGQRSTPTRLRQRPQQRPRLVTNPAITGGNRPSDFLRQVSSGAVWGVGGTSTTLQDSLGVVLNSSQNQTGRGLAAPVFMAKFLPKNTKSDDRNKHESRLALALDMDLTTRLLDTFTTCPETPPKPTSPQHEQLSPFMWKDNGWKKGERGQWPRTLPKQEIVPPKPFRILDAPYLRDDFYCSTLAYSFTSGVLAVGLGQYVYLWSEGLAVDHPPFGEVHSSNYVTSISFSSEDGGQSILAVGRQSGQLSLWGLFEAKVRFDLSHPNGISCVAFKPRASRRLSERYPHLEIDAEDLAVGDESGTIWYYSVEWPEIRHKWSWPGCMTLLAKISAHSQQVCGLAWSPDDRFLATGGNDNACLLFELRGFLPPPPGGPSLSDSSTVSSTGTTIRAFPCFTMDVNSGRLGSRGGHHIVSHLLPSWVDPPPVKLSATVPLLSHTGTLIAGIAKTVLVPYNHQKHRLVHSAAVKAIAFAPWQPSLLATGGGSNDRAIHFFHARTGVCLATINVFAQVTSLIWSQTRREIAATFGYAQPEHPFRIAVFAWPSCAQVAVIPWGPYGSSWDGHEQDLNYDCGRALWAVSYPGRPPRPPSITFEDADLYGASSSASSAGPLPTRSQSSQRQNTARKRKRGSRIVRPKEKEGGMWCSRTMEEGCIIVASSDQTVKFHEVWTGRRKSTGFTCGLLGGSAILEGMEGIEKSGSEVIR